MKKQILLITALAALSLQSIAQLVPETVSVSFTREGGDVYANTNSYIMGSTILFTNCLAFAGPGVKVLVIAVSLERTWATAAGTMATANAAFTPGALLYLS